MPRVPSDHPGAGAAIPDVKTPDVRLLSAWAILATVLALAVMWRLVHNCFQLGVLARSPKLGRLDKSEGRSAGVLASHFSSVANAVVCLTSYLTAAQQRVAADGWSLGALFPLSSRRLAIGPPLSGTSTFYLSLAGFCLHASVLAAERAARGVAVERMALLQRSLLLLLASSVCMVEHVPELALVLLLMEVPSPFVALWQALQDFRLRSDPLYGISGVAAVFMIALCRLFVFGLCLGCAISHPEARQKLSKRWFMLSLEMSLLVAYAVHFARLCRDLCRDMQDAKDPREATRTRRSSET